MAHDKTTHAARVAGKNGFSLISDEKFRSMYAALLQCSLLDAQLRAQKGYLAWSGCCAGSAGVVSCLRADDSITPTPRGVLARYLHDGELDLGTAAATSDAPLHLATATADALRHQLEDRGGVSVVFTEVLSSRTMRKVFAVAAQQLLPVLYVLGGATPSPELLGDIPVIRVDAADTVAVYRVAYESILRAREGGGPTIVVCAPWPDEPELDPLFKLESYLTAKKLFRRDWKLRLEKKYRNTISKAVRSSGRK